MQFRVGLGKKKYRIKPRAEQKNKFWIGGVEIEDSKYIYDHDASDDASDVIQLAVADALFGATALGDGQIVFNKEKTQIPLKGNPRKEAPRILARTYNFIRKNWYINNIDITLEIPSQQKMDDYKHAIFNFICTALRITELTINLKVREPLNSNEISCLAVVLVERQRLK
ncbi:2-C-methyl-D-erythritol 2,4-cyclodiphosphate synthase [Mycoplasmoides pneumoniae]|uniref:2-C-methyl-D-erythritol 2,4-cyclodiphosphate synthase n=1 Tax=Mycoplasmoides pneumoniae TaxID=2104 RepID=UPI0013306019|nr:2-C-methyl-D-erythritol 2,4-cyclodiphosphate synthase [Mycoplasmoides pneumoniae]